MINKVGKSFRLISLLKNESFNTKLKTKVDDVLSVEKFKDGEFAFKFNGTVDGDDIVLLHVSLSVFVQTV